MNKATVRIATVLLGVSWCGWSHADLIVLRDGGQVDGQVTMVNGAVVHILNKGSNLVLSRDSVQRIEFAFPPLAVREQSRGVTELTAGQTIRARVTSLNRNAIQNSPYFIALELLSEAKVLGGEARTGAAITGQVMQRPAADGSLRWNLELDTMTGWKGSYRLQHVPLSVVNELPPPPGVPFSSRLSPENQKLKEAALENVPLTWMREGAIIEISVPAEPSKP